MSYDITYDPMEVVGKPFVKEDRRDVPWKYTVIECSEDTGKFCQNAYMEVKNG